MGTRYIVTVICPKCGKEDTDVYYAPTCGVVSYRCESCWTEIDLEEYTGITHEEASNAVQIRAAVSSIVSPGGRGEEEMGGLLGACEALLEGIRSLGHMRASTFDEHYDGSGERWRDCFAPCIMEPYDLVRAAIEAVKGEAMKTFEVGLDANNALGNPKVITIEADDHYCFHNGNLVFKIGEEWVGRVAHGKWLYVKEVVKSENIQSAV